MTVKVLNINLLGADGRIFRPEEYYREAYGFVWLRTALVAASFSGETIDAECVETTICTQPHVDFQYVEDGS